MGTEPAALPDAGVPAPFHIARDAVNRPVLRRWCDALGVVNPLYTDETVASRTRMLGIVSPLSMLDVWTKPGLAYVRNAADPQGAAFGALDREGYTSAVAVSSELVAHRAIRLSEVLGSTITLEAVSPEKATALGAARFVTTRQDFLSGTQQVGYSRFTVMRFRPGGDARRPSPPPRAETHDAGVEAEPARDASGTVTIENLVAGRSLPVVAVPITTTLIIAGALMTSDYYESHHDRDLAVQRGSTDIFMNIHTTLGLLERCVGDWLGPDVVWRSMSVRLGVPNYPGDTMTVYSEVDSADTGTGDVVISVRAVNSLGSHASGLISVNLPV